MDRSELKNWAANLEDASVQAAAWKSIAADWVKEDSWQASEWIAQLPDGKGRDSAVLSLAERIQKTDPDLAWKWGLSMGDPELKTQALSAAAASWRDKNPEALAQAMNEGNLTETERQAISEKLHPAAK